MDSAFQTLVAAIALAGSAHTIVSYYRDKAERQRTREALERLDVETRKQSD